MSTLLLAAALAVPPARALDDASRDRKAYGVLVLAYEVDQPWRQELDDLRGKLKAHPVETVTGATDSITVQRAVDRLVEQKVKKIVAVPIETVSDSARLEMTRYMFGVRADPLLDEPAPPADDFAGKAPPTKLRAKTALSATASRFAPDDSDDTSVPKRLKSPVPLVLAPALDKSPLLVEILADRAKALSRLRGRETLLLAGVGPRDDAALKAWKTDAQAIAEAVGAKAGFLKAAAVALRDSVRPDQQGKDQSDLLATMRALSRQGRVCIVPLSPEAEYVEGLLKQDLDDKGYLYRWDGRGIQGDRRLADWIKDSAEEASKLPDGRRYKGVASGAPHGGTQWTTPAGW